MSEATIIQYIKTASPKKLDALMGLIEKQRLKQFEKENFGMTYAEFQEMVDEARASGSISLNESRRRLWEKYGSKSGVPS